jgi:hypothetical protein
MPKTTKAVLLLAIAGLSGQAQQYTKNGELMLPGDYRKWDFLSSSISMSYPEEGPGGHAMFGNLFVQPSAHQQFEKTGTWPDKTVLLMELRNVGGASTDSFLNKDAQFQTEIMGWEAHVKDSARGGWAFYFIRKDAASGKALEKSANCFSCHQNHGAVDTTFVQYYPTLIEAAKQHGTYKDPSQRAASTR